MCPNSNALTDWSMPVFIDSQNCNVVCAIDVFQGRLSKSNHSTVTLTMARVLFVAFETIIDLYFILQRKIYFFSKIYLGAIWYNSDLLIYSAYLIIDFFSFSLSLSLYSPSFEALLPTSFLRYVQD